MVSFRKAYIFDIELDGSRDPVIKRTVDKVLASYTFQELHYVLQYAFAWQNYHLHGFTFHEPLPPPPIDGRFVPRIPKEALRIIGEEDDFDDFLGPAPLLDKKVKLLDVYGARGRYRKRVLQEGAIPPMLYEYDFGVSFGRFGSLLWRHTLMWQRRTAGSTRLPSGERRQPPPIDPSSPKSSVSMTGYTVLALAHTPRIPSCRRLRRIEWLGRRQEGLRGGEPDAGPARAS